MSDVDCLDQFRKRVLYAVDRLAGEFLHENPQLVDEMLYRLAEGPPREFKDQLAALVAKVVTGPDTEFTRNNLVYRLLDKAASKSDLVRVLQDIFWILEEGRFPSLEVLAGQIDRAATELPFIGLRVATRRGGAIIYPAGVRLLDDRAVNDSLDWLGEHPKAKKQFSHALETYMRGSPCDYRGILDDLRHGLEQLMRDVLHNRKSLEKQTESLLRWLGANGVHQGCIDLYQALLGKFAWYQNEAVKHGDESSVTQVEFMIYLTGTFMRFLLQVERDSAADVTKLEALAKKAELL